MEYENDQERRDDIKPAQEMAKTILHQPMGDAVFVLPFPKVCQVGQILLPNQSAITVYEGHVFAKGPDVSSAVGLGDCIIWAMHSETGLSIDSLPKFSVIPVNQILANYRSGKARQWNMHERAGVSVRSMRELVAPVFRDGMIDPEPKPRVDPPSDAGAANTTNG